MEELYAIMRELLEVEYNQKSCCTLWRCWRRHTVGKNRRQKAWQSAASDIIWGSCTGTWGQ